MSKIYLYNTLTRQKELFKSLKKGVVGLYTCGPTVYNFAHLGNLRTYLFEDFLKRTLEYNDYRVKHIMNVTDVGHLTGDMDMGEDKMEAGAKREGKTAWEIAKFYEDAFKADLLALNIESPTEYHRVTANIPEQIALISKLEKKGFTYQTSDGLYFDTAKIKNYNKLSHLPLQTLREGARVEKNPEKKNPTDFALWKFSPAGAKRQMEWKSPWGVGFPGWHIECSAISLKYLSNNLDIHCGGIDHINIHHTNEIAQSEAATGKKFFNYWLHGAFLNIHGGKKMAKSAGNFLTINNALLKKKLNPLAYRFAACQVHYRKPMEYSDAGLKQAQQGLQKLTDQVALLGAKTGKINSDFKSKFLEAINNDLNMPKALAVLALVLKSKIKAEDKLATVLDFDKVLGLNLQFKSQESRLIKTEKLFPAAIGLKAGLRDEARRNHDWTLADKLRREIEDAGYLIVDTATGSVLKKK